MNDKIIVGLITACFALLFKIVFDWLKMKRNGNGNGYVGLKADFKDLTEKINHLITQATINANNIAHIEKRLDQLEK